MCFTSPESSCGSRVSRERARPAPRFLLAAAVLLLAPAAAPLLAQAPSDPAEQVAALLRDLDRDLGNHDVAATVGRLDLPRLLEEARAALGLRCDPDGRTRAAERLEMHLARPVESLPSVLRAPAPRREIVRVDAAADGTEYVAVGREWDAEDYCRPVRWRILRRDDGLRVFDREDLDTGSRLSLLLVLRCDRLLADLRVPAVASLAEVARAADAVRDGDLAAAEEALLSAGRGFAPPPAVEAWRRTLLAEVSLWGERLRPALRHAGAAAALAPASPAALYVRARARLAAGDGPGALADARAAQEASAGGSAECYRVLARVLLDAGKPDEALAAVLAGLALEPRNPWLLALLAEARPDGEDFAARLARIADPYEAASSAIDALLDADRPEAAAMAAAKYRLLRPDDHRGGVLVARLLCAAGRHEDAGPLLLGACARAPAEAQTALREGYMDEMAAAGRPLEAYAALPDKAAAFDYLSRAVEDPAAFAALVEAHRPRAGDDRMFLYCDGLVHAERGEWADAERLWARAAEVTDDEALDPEALRRERVRNLLDAGEWRLALETVGPRRATFRDLAEGLAERVEVESLADLVALDEAEDPEDPAIALYQGVLLALNGRHADAVDLLLAHRARVEADPDDAWWLRERLRRSLIRLARFDAALAEAGRETVPADRAFAEAQVFAAAGRPEDLRRALEELEDFGFVASEFYAAAHIGEALRSEAFSALRAEFPE